MTGKQTGRQMLDEQMMNIVRGKGEGRKREAPLFGCKESIRTQYV